jgi:hypothetical protein
MDYDDNDLVMIMDDKDNDLIMILMIILSFYSENCLWKYYLLQWSALYKETDCCMP